MITFNKLQSEVGAWSRKKYPRKRPYTSLLEAQHKLGELAKEVALLELGEQGTAASHQSMMEDAVANCIISLVEFCERNEIDSGDTICHVWQKIKMRNWSPDDGIAPASENQ